MEEELKTNEADKTDRKHSRPVFLTALCLFSFVYFGVFTILFLLGLFYSGTITTVIAKYLPAEAHSSSVVHWIFAGGFLSHLLGFIGSVLLWKLRKSGYFLIAGICLIVAVFQTFRPDISVASTAVYILLLLLFGVFFKRYS
jgi:hypothetical protein